MTFIQVSSGKKFDVISCTLDEIEIEDIAHGLSNICRFTGQIPVFYSVAQHCIEMSYYAPESVRLEALMHDASEAYLGDVSKHLKETIGLPYKAVEDDLMVKIATKFAFAWPCPTVIKVLDHDMLETEFKQVWRKRDPSIPSYGVELPVKLRPMTPTLAKEIFLSRYEALKRV
jgi:hypothetical protein